MKKKLFNLAFPLKSFKKGVNGTLKLHHFYNLMVCKEHFLFNFFLRHKNGTSSTIKIHLMKKKAFVNL